MKIALAWSYVSHSCFLEQIAADIGTPDGLFSIKVDLKIFPKSAGVIIPDCFAVSKCLEYGIAG